MGPQGAAAPHALGLLCAPHHPPRSLAALQGQPPGVSHKSQVTSRITSEVTSHTSQPTGHNARARSHSVAPFYFECSFFFFLLRTHLLLHMPPTCFPGPSSLLCGRTARPPTAPASSQWGTREWTRPHQWRLPWRFCALAPTAPRCLPRSPFYSSQWGPCPSLPSGTSSSRSVSTNSMPLPPLWNTSFEVSQHR